MAFWDSPSGSKNKIRKKKNGFTFMLPLRKIPAGLKEGTRRGKGRVGGGLKMREEGKRRGREVDG